MLIADDNPDARKMIRDIFYGRKMSVYEAENGRRAFELAHEHKSDLILLDLRMPEVNGY